MANRVVITGMGALTPIGNTLDEFRRGLIGGLDGIAPLTAFDGDAHRFRMAGELKGFDPLKYFSAEAVAHSSRATQMARVAAAEAIADAGLDLSQEDRTRIGVILGTDLGGMPACQRGYSALHYPFRSGRARSREIWTSLWLDSSICSVSDQLALEHGLHGLNLVVSTACSAGLHAIGIGAESIRGGMAQVMLVGGVDPLSAMPQAGFGVLRSLTNTIRPFSQGRDGTVLGEAAAILVLENEEHARRRDAPIWATVSGYGSSTDAYHMTRPEDSGDGAARAMKLALEDASLRPEEIDYVKAHGTGTPANDRMETRAIKQVFGKRTRVPVSSVKSMIGHTLGASGAAEAVAAVLALEGGFLPPTLHLDTPDAECDLDFVPHRSRRQPVRAVLANAFGFGGNNASMVFQQAAFGRSVER